MGSIVELASVCRNSGRREHNALCVERGAFAARPVPRPPFPAMIRLARAADGARVAEIYSPAVTERATSFELEAPDATEMSQRIVACLERMPWLVAEDDGNVVGYAYASPHRTRLAYQWSVEVSAYVDERAQRRGVGRGLYEALFRVLVLQGFRNAYAGITLPNAASEGLHRRLSFTQHGVCLILA